MSEKRKNPKTDHENRPDNTPDQADRMAIIDRFLENQSKELEIESLNFELKKQDLDNQYKIANKSIQAQVDDLKDRRRFDYKKRLLNISLYSGIAVIATGFLIFCLTTDNKEIANTVIEKAVSIGLGLIGGYYYGRSKGAKPSSAGQADQYTSFRDDD